MILPVTKITNISDFINTFKSLSLITDQNDTSNDNSDNNDSDQNESIQLDDDCDLDESL